MKTRLAVAGAILLSLKPLTLAHRLDEYLQATTLSIERDRVQAQISLMPGVAVFPMVLAKIDTDTDGVISDAERQAYAERILHDLSLTVDGHRLRLRLVSSEFARTEEMKEGSRRSRCCGGGAPELRIMRPRNHSRLSILDRRRSQDR